MRSLLLTLLVLLTTCVGAQTIYNDFHNYPFDGLPVQVNCFVEDSDGQIWFGTSQGLYSYDGNTAHQRINDCGQVYSVVIKNDTAYVGTDEGLLLMDIPTGSVHKSNSQQCHMVRAILINRDGSLYLGSAEGLYRYANGIIKQINDDNNLKLSHPTIYSLAHFDNDNIFIGTYNGLCIYNHRYARISTIEIPFYTNKSNCFVNSLLVDSANVWIGLEGELLKYSKRTCRVERTMMAYSNSIKSLAHDIHDNLLIGTDNGLFIYDKETNERHIVHNAKSANSLIGNIVWGLYSDRQGGMWIGTDCGVSMSDLRNKFVSVSDITGLPDGNTFYSIMKDSKQRLWLGGSNGLLLTNDDFSESAWYRLGDKRYSLPHNRVRAITEDNDGEIWLASDGGVNRFDEKQKRFVRYNIEDKTANYNANWTYQIVDDGHGSLWIATCLGGVLVVNKEAFKTGSTYIKADMAITRKDGLANNYVEQLQYDNYNYMYALCNRAGVYRIDMKTHIATGLGHTDASTIYTSTDGSLWIGSKGKVTHIYPDGKEIEIALPNDVKVYAISEENDVLWLLSSDGLWLAENDKVRKSATDKHTYVSLYVDADNHQLYMGGMDGFSSWATNELRERKASDRKTFLSKIYVGDSLYNSNKDARYITCLDLDYRDNRLTFEVADFDYSSTDKSVFAYRMEGVDESWHTMGIDENRIYFSGLLHGQYTLHIGKQLPNGSFCTDVSLPIIIAPPFYLSTWATALYFVILTAIMIFIVFFFNLKQRLRIEHIEKVKTLEQTKIKIDFFTNVSHEFKTPMSMIIAPLSNAVSKMTDSVLKREVNTALLNARQLNSMINRALNLARIDNNIYDRTILAPIDIIEFLKSVFNMHSQATASKAIDWQFETNTEKAYVNVDAVKLESVLNNLLSNAYKYTEEGFVKLSVNVDKDVVFIVKDSGIGIPTDELPNVFNKFYRSSKTQTREDSTGIGLYLVKQYVETFGGNVEVTSNGSNGTTFTVRLPLLPPESVAGDEQKVITAGNSEGVKVLIVEDNVQIAEFIASIFAEHYNVRIAHNGQMGLDIANLFRPDIVIADIMMPVMDGMEMARKLKKNDLTKETPIIMLTAKNDRQTESESLRNCVDIFMSKPFEPQQLILRVEQMLKMRRATENRLRMESLTEAKPIVAVSTDEKFAAKIVEVIEKHMTDSNFNVNALADIMATSPKQLYRKIKAFTGQTPVEYISGIKMKKAAMLLSQGSFTVAEVMYMVGFSNHSYFAKCFSAVYGMTPKQYIANCENNKLNDTTKTKQ
jgi:signal transduction histidine kinase/ligand-binding sensor domain-containing protein/DNA-binding response OmpR family regulator